jgi:hypothetical protein
MPYFHQNLYWERFLNTYLPKKIKVPSIIAAIINKGRITVRKTFKEFQKLFENSPYKVT